MQGAGHDAAAATLTIPGFTHPVRDLFLEDVLEATGFAVGRGSRWAKRGTPQAGIQVTALICVGVRPLWSQGTVDGTVLRSRAKSYSASHTCLSACCANCYLRGYESQSPA